MGREYPINMVLITGVKIATRLYGKLQRLSKELLFGIDAPRIYSR